MENDFELLSKYGINIAEFKVVKNLEEAKEAVSSIGYPVVLKISTKQPVHKTDIGCVKLDVTQDNIESAFNEIIKNAKKNNIDYDGLFVQKMEKSDIEVIAGVKQDPQFGPIILFGLGGIYAEVFKDFSIRVCPISKEDAFEMIEDLKTKGIFHARGKEYNKDAIANLLLKLSEIASKGEIKEMDLNPIIMYPKDTDKDYVVVDVRIVR